MLDPTMEAALRQIAHGLAAQFGANCEVVVHDPSNLESSIVLIENGHVSHRTAGGGPSHIVLESLKQDPAALSDKLAYLTRTHDGRVMKSSTMYIRDKNGAISAIFAINYDITELLAAENSLRGLTSTASNGSSPSEPENIPRNVNDLLDELIAQSIRLVGKPVSLMTRADKMKAIQFLNSSGAFLISKSGDKVTRQFGISKYTMYSYLDALREEDPEDK